MKPRDEAGKGPMRRMRQSGMIPAILYGGDGEPEKLKVEYSTIERLLAKESENAILNLEIEGSSQETLAMFKDIQRETVSSKFVHIDLLRIRMNENVYVDIPIQLKNESAVRRGEGIIQQLLDTVPVACLPMAIPEHVELDLEGAEIGSSYTVGDLIVPEGVEVQLDSEDTVLSVLAPKITEEDAGLEVEGEEGEEGVEGEEGEASEGAEGEESEAE